MQIYQIPLTLHILQSRLANVKCPIQCKYIFKAHERRLSFLKLQRYVPPNYNCTVSYYHSYCRVKLDHVTNKKFKKHDIILHPTQIVVIIEY